MKRVFDLLVSATLLVVLCLPMLAIALLVAIFLGTPVFFRQRRPGLRGKSFEMVKFRSMRDTVDSRGQLLPDGARLTRFGRMLRATSLDELPELFNVLKGDMSLVGPRPLLEQYMSRYSPDQARRHDVRPGITGWAQVNGRNAISWERKFELDLWYVDHHTLGLDLKILAMTVVKVFRRDGISAANQDTMAEFMGSASGTSA